MKNTKYSLIALDEFQCIGSECSRNCCMKDWTIKVDDKTFKKWDAAPQDDRLWLLNNIQDSETKQGGHEIKFTDATRCGLLSPDNTCMVHEKFGSSFLPDICRMFPRKNIDTKYKTYNTANFACPEITRLVFTGDTTTDPFKRLKSQRSKVKHASDHDYIIARIDELITLVLDFKDCKLGGKLFYISDILSKLLEGKSYFEISREIVDEIYLETKIHLSSINEAIENEFLKPNVITAGSYWKVVYDLCNSRSINSNYLLTSSHPLSVALNKTTPNNDHFELIYQLICDIKKEAQPFIDTNVSTMLHRYIRVHFSFEGLPLAPHSGSQLTTLIHCMTGLCILQLLIWIKIIKDGEISPEFLQDIIVEIHRQYVSSDTVNRRLQEDPAMNQLEKYNACFLDLF